MSARAQPATAVAHDAAAVPGRRAWRWVVGWWAAGRLLVAAAAVAAAALPSGPDPHARGVSSGLQLWDGWWYLQVARHWYDPAFAHGQTAAFAPGFPALWRALMLIPGPPALIAGIANSLVFLAALAVVHVLTRRVLDERRARLTVLVMALFPVSFVYSLPYSESLFLLLAAGSFLLLDRRRDGAGAALAALACVVRPTGLTVAAGLAVAVWRRGRRARASALTAVALLATAAVVAGVGIAAHDPLAQFNAQQSGWGRGLGFPPLVVWRYLDTNLVHFRHPLRAVTDTAFLGLWTVLGVKLWRMRVAPEYIVFAAAAVAMPLVGGSALSMGRFGMVAFPFSWALADWADAGTARLRLTAGLLAAGLLMLEVASLHASAYVP